MDGTTLCPHCDTRFKIAYAQLEAHQGMVRCGHCRQAFDARINFIPDTPHPQFELVLPEVLAAAPVVSSAEAIANDVMKEAAHPSEHHDSLDFSIPAVVADEAKTQDSQLDAEQEPTLAEQVEVVTEGVQEVPRKKRTGLWIASALVLLLILLAQVAYFFRADIAARAPGTKPLLLGYCELLACKIALPQKSDLMSIEFSSLEADPNNAAQITLNALLRNRATYPLAFPNLELTLNDRQDKPVARRIIKPTDYLTATESEQAGLQANHEFNLKVPLDTSDLNPNGYRLVVIYPAAR